MVPDFFEAARREWFAVRPEGGSDGMPCPFCVVSARDANNTVETCPDGCFLCASCGCVVRPSWCSCVEDGPDRPDAVS
jgi:hypothetical protein